LLPVKIIAPKRKAPDTNRGGGRWPKKKAPRERSERDLVVAVDAAGGTVPLPDGRTVTVGRAEFDALLGERRNRAWVIVRKQAPMPARR
jgi:hypothetical protein